MSLTEDDVRRIVREEMSKILDAAGKKVEVPEYLKTGPLEDALVSIIDTIATNEATEKVNSHEDYYYHAQS